MNLIQPLPLKDVVIDDAFWNRYIQLVREKVIPYQWEALNDRIPDAARSHCIKNFEIAAGRREGQYYGMVFQDSDLYKWLESVSFSLAASADPALEKCADSAIRLIGEAQQPDGYLNTYYTVKEPGKRWSNLQQGHELYCAGHMIEAAAAYYNATGKRDFLETAIRFADCIDDTFGFDEGKLHGYPGHQEIELALVKLYRITKERRYLKLAEYFIRQRGAKPNYFDLEREKTGYRDIFPELASLDRSYSQSHMAPIHQQQAVGHAVRAVYMYSAMADLAAELNDWELRVACGALFDDIAQSQMYITGAIGATAVGESFASAHDLPGDLIYGETCASVGLMMFARRMHALHADARYADIMERALYNTVLAGISLNGTEFYYVNPLEVEPKRIGGRPELQHVKPVRQKWFDCSCCPTNIARTIMGLGAYLYAASPDGLYVNLYCSGSCNDGERRVTVKTDYPYDGEISIKAAGGRYRLYLRSPASAPVLSLTVNGKARPFTAENGYLALEEDWGGDEVKLVLDMRTKLVYSAPKVQCNIGKAAVCRGPLVYCAEEVDNGERLGAYLLPHDAAFKDIAPPKGLPGQTVALQAAAYKYNNEQEELYSTAAPTLESAELKMIPYHLWANRGENEMRVYLKTAPAFPESPGE